MESACRFSVGAVAVEGVLGSAITQADGGTTVPASLLRFGGFELDPASFQLRRSGRPLRLERIPLELLLLLVERRGQLVLRQEIAERIWGRDVVLDIDNALNTAIRKVRRALRDDPAQARYVETVPAKGYRFIGAVTSTARPEVGRDAEIGRAHSRSQPIMSNASPGSYTSTSEHLVETIPAPKSALDGERKQVTVLFAHLEAAVELLAGRDPEEARTMLDPVLEYMMDAVRVYEGTVNQVMEDGIMALFGAPRAHEDHAVRACYAALRMQEMVKQHAESARRQNDVPIHIRVGLNSGEVVVRHIGSDLQMHYTAVGQATHLAARMAQLAVPGSVLATADTLRLVAGYVQIKPLGLVTVKDLGEPVEAYEVTERGEVRSPFQAAAARGFSRFVGRDTELAQLHRALEQAQQGRGQVAAVVGEPGVGKSRLVFELVRSHHAEGWLVLEARPVSYGKATSYLPVIDLLKGYFRISDRDTHRDVLEKVTARILALDRALETTLPALLALLDVPFEDPQWQGLDPPQRRQRIVDAVKRLVLRETRTQPLLLVVEDLHWIDTETQAFLDSLVESLPAAPLLLLVDYRPEYRHLWGSKTYYRQLRIDPLPAESAEDLLASLLGHDPGLQPLKRLLINHTEGNPLFLEESIRTLLETGALAGERGAYRLTRSVSSLQVPASVHAVLAARVDRLNADDKQLLQAAAVVGKDVPLALLQGVSGVDENAVTLGLAHLRSAEFLYETSLFPELEYTFKHALTHEVAYASLLVERRRALHAQIVRTIEARFADRLPQHVERLAHHALRGEVWDKALLYLRQAGHKAALRSAHREAAACFDQALTVLGHLEDGREAREAAIDLRLDLRASLFTLGELSRIPVILGEAEGIAAAIGDRRRQGLALLDLSNQYFQLVDYARSGDYAERALAIARELGDAGIEAQATLRLGAILSNVGEFRRAIDLLGRAVPGLREHPLKPYHGESGILACLCLLARALIQVGEFVPGMDRAKEAIQLAEAADASFQIVHGHFALGFAHLRKGDLERAVPVLERGLGIARARSISFMEPLLCSAVGAAYAQSGRIAEGLSLLEGGLGKAARQGQGSVMHLKIWLAAGYLLAKRQTDAAALALESFAAAHQVGRTPHEADARHVLGEIAASAQPPQMEEAEGHYRAALALADELGMQPLVAHCHLGLGKLYRRTGKREQAHEHLATATTMYREMDMRFYLEQAEVEMRA
jgi:class 3 adenylate cyclase/tetratricopeptide (TPR) repeat protein